MWLPTKQAQKGFTLIEVLLALGIFAMLALASNQVFRSVVSSNE